jgi:hypothetical protein
MFDYIKIQDLIVKDKNELANKLDLTLSVLPSTGELINEDKKRHIKNLEIFFKENNYIHLTGSIHKYFNNGHHNFNDFNVSNLFSTLKELAEIYGIDLFNSKLNNLEIGVNIEVPFNVDKFIQKILIHKGSNYIIKRNKNMNFVEFIHSNYYIKIYNKGKQYRKDYNLVNEILRFEIKVSKMEYLHSKDININTLIDLLNYSIYPKLTELIVSTYNEILIYDDSVVLSKLDKKSNEFYTSANNREYWLNELNKYTQYDPKKELKKYNSTRTKYNRNILKFKDIISKYSSNGWNQLVGYKIAEKWNELIHLDTTLKNEINSYLSIEKCNKLTDPTHIDNNKKCNNLTTSIYSDIDTSLNNKCIVTGIRLYNNEVKYLGKNHIKKIAIENPSLYASLKNKYFCNKNNKSNNLDTESYLIAHNIRNVDTNKRNNLRKKIMQSSVKNTLFNTNEYLVLNDEQLNLISFWNNSNYRISI